MAVFWVIAPCSLVEVYQRFRGPCCLHHQGDEWSILVILGSHCCKNISHGLLGCDAMESCTSIPMFWKNISLPSLGLKR
jgi:hypothetical protein